MGILNFFRNNIAQKNINGGASHDFIPDNVTTASKSSSFTSKNLFDFYSLYSFNNNDSLYYSIRKSIPIIDAAILKMTRLIGDFSVDFHSDDLNRRFEQFKKNVNTGYGSCGLNNFINNYFDNIITYGNAIAEVIYDKDDFAINTISNIPRAGLSLARRDDGIVEIYKNDSEGTNVLLPNQEYFIFTPLNPGPMNEFGTSLLDSLPFVSEILLKIFKAVGENWDRIGNVHFCVNYKQDKNSTDKNLAKDRTNIIASKWSEVMSSGNNSAAKDFIALGDIEINTIGADCPIPNSEIPVRQLLEQITAKLGIPPFLLGLSWSTTERMSKQQVEVFSYELDYYRRLLQDALCRIINLWLDTQNDSCSFNYKNNYSNNTSYDIVWKNKDFFIKE